MWFLLLHNNNECLFFFQTGFQLVRKSEEMAGSLILYPNYLPVPNYLPEKFLFRVSNLDEVSLPL